MLVGICLVWALNTIVSKLAVDDLALPAIFYAVARSLLVAVALSPWLRPVPRPLALVLFVALSIGAGSFALMFLGLQSASPSAAAIVSLLSAPSAVLLAIALLGERIGWRRTVGIGLTIAGVVIVLAAPGDFVASAGLILVALSAVAGALGAVLLKKLDVRPLQLQAWSGLSGVLFLTPLSVVFENGQLGHALAAGWAFIGLILFSGAVVSIGAHTLYFRILQRHDANLVAPLTLMTPIFTIILGAAITGDRIGANLVVGGSVAIFGVLIVALRSGPKIPRRFLVRSRI